MRASPSCNVKLKKTRSNKDIEGEDSSQPLLLSNLIEI